MKLVSITWSSELPLLLQAAKEIGLEMDLWSSSQLSSSADLERCLESLKKAQLILLHPSSDACWDEIIPALNYRTPVISFGRDPSHWALANVSPEITQTVNKYLLFGGPENYKNMLKYACKEVLGLDFEFDQPQELLWQGFYHPRAQAAFATLDEYLEWYGALKGPTVGIVFSRTYWANGDTALVDAFIAELEKQYSVLPVFCFGMATGTLVPGRVLRWQRRSSWAGLMRSSISSLSSVHEILRNQPIFSSRSMSRSSIPSWSITRQ